MNFQRSSVLLGLLCATVQLNISAPAGGILDTSLDATASPIQRTGRGVEPSFHVETYTTDHKNATSRTRRQVHLGHDDTPRYDSCQPHTFRRRITRPNCKPIFARVKGCRGACISDAIPSTLRDGTYTSPLHPTIEKHCRCCSPAETKIGRFHLNCSTVDQLLFYPVEVEVAVTCTCRPCHH